MTILCFRHKLKMEIANDCRSGFVLPCAMMRGTLVLSVYHLTFSCEQWSLNSDSILRTAASSRQVELRRLSVSVHVPLNFIWGTSWTCPPQPISLASE